MVSALLQRLGVQPAEQGLFGSAGLCLVLMGAAAFGLLNTAEALFLKRVGVESLPIALLASSGLLVLTTGLVGRFASRNPTRWLPRILTGLALAPLPFLLLVDSTQPLVFGALVLVARQVLALGMLAFWLATGSLVPGRRAKQLFAPLAAGVTVGAILGSFGSEPLTRLVGVDGLFAVCSLMLAAAAVMGGRLRHYGTRKLDRALGTAAPAARRGSAKLGQLVRSNPAFRLLGFAMLAGGALSPVLYFEFSSVLDASSQGPGGEQRLLFLYAQYRGWMSVAMLFTQLWLSSFLYRTIGLPLALATWPLSFLVGFAWLGLDFSLLPAFFTYGSAQVSEDGVADSAARVLYNLFPDGVRPRAAGLLEGPVNRLGGVLGNGFVLVALALDGAGWLGWSALPVAGLWLGTSLVLWRAYPALLLRASAEHGLAGAGIDRAILLDGATLRGLAGGLLDPDPRVCRAAVELVADGEASQAVPLLAEAAETAPEANRPLLVEALHRLVEQSPVDAEGSELAARSVAAALETDPPLPPEERADLLQVYARLTGGPETPEPLRQESWAVLERAMGNPAAPVRLAALAERHRRGAAPPGLPDLDRMLADALSASDALVRRAARKELRALLLASDPDAGPDAVWEQRLRVLVGHLDQRADRADTAEALREVARRHGAHTRTLAEEALRYVEDRDPRVRSALLAVAGHAGLQAEGPRLVAALGSRAALEAEGAREGLVALGAAAALPLLVGRELGHPDRRQAILSVLRELEVDTDTLDELRQHQIDAVQTTVTLRGAVEGIEGAAAALLRRRLEEALYEQLGALLDLLAALHEDPRLAELERHLRRSTEARQVDLAVETMDALLSRAERDAIIPLLEPGPWGTRGAAAASTLGRRTPSSAAAIQELLRAPDPSLRQLAAAVEAAQTIGDAGSMPSAMDIAVRLQEVPAFDRLATPQLLALAELLQEQKAGEGERIYATGEEGLGLYFVLEGEVELRRGALVLERVGPGRFFGELSSLDGIPRSADAVATEPTRMLRLDREDLLSLVEDAPALALGLAQFLSARVRRLQDRLEDAAEPAAEGTPGE